MNNILSKLLQRKGIKTVDELSPEEKQTFALYETILARKEMTLADLKEFLGAQISIIENKWRDLGHSADKKAEMIPYHTVYKVILQAIDAPQAERQALEQVLIQQLQ